MIAGIYLLANKFSAKFTDNKLNNENCPASLRLFKSINVERLGGLLMFPAANCAENVEK